jgi:hypothetical protein
MVSPPISRRFNPKEFLEPLRRQRGIARRVLDIAVPKVGLDRPRIVAVVGELVAAGVAQHVGVRLDAEVGLGCRGIFPAATLKEAEEGNDDEIMQTNDTVRLGLDDRRRLAEELSRLADQAQWFADGISKGKRGRASNDAMKSPGRETGASLRWLELRERIGICLWLSQIGNSRCLPFGAPNRKPGLWKANHRYNQILLIWELISSAVTVGCKVGGLSWSNQSHRKSSLAEGCCGSPQWLQRSLRRQPCCRCQTLALRVIRLPPRNRALQRRKQSPRAKPRKLRLEIRWLLQPIQHQSSNNGRNEKPSRTGQAGWVKLSDACVGRTTHSY